MSTVPIGKITVDYYLAENGRMITYLEVEGDLPMIVQLGLLDMARDTILHPNGTEAGK